MENCQTQPFEVFRKMYMLPLSIKTVCFGVAQDDTQHDCMKCLQENSVLTTNTLEHIRPEEKGLGPKPDLMKFGSGSDSGF